MNVLGEKAWFQSREKNELDMARAKEVGDWEKIIEIVWQQNIDNWADRQTDRRKNWTNPVDYKEAE